MSRVVLHHVETGRRPITLIGLGFSACFLAFAIAGGAPWWFYPPVVFATLGTAYMVLLNPRSGLTLDQVQLTAFSGSWHRTVELADLVSLHIVEWSDGPPTTTAILKDGSNFDIPAVCLPKKTALVDAARQCGIPIA